MKKREAQVILELGQDAETEELKRNYFSRFITCFRQRSSAVTVDEVEHLEGELKRINDAYVVFGGHRSGDDNELQLDFRIEDLDKIKSDVHVGLGKFETEINNLIKRNEVVLAIRLLEAGISQALKKDALPERINITESARLMGSVLLQCGLIRQGLPFQTYGMNDYEKGLVCFHVGEHPSAVQYLAGELKNRATVIPIDEICQMISTSYFLMNDYQNAVKVIEDLLPKLMLKKEIFQEYCKSRDFATVILLSLSKLTGIKGNKLNVLKLRVKYPMCVKYFQTCFGSVKKAIDVLTDLNRNPNAYDNFLESLQRKPSYHADITLHYDIQNLQNAYYDIFNSPLQKSLIYHPK